MVLVECKSFGKDLGKAESQAFRHIQDLAREGRTNEIPGYVIVSDFARITLHDLEPEDQHALPLSDNRPVATIEFPLSLSATPLCGVGNSCLPFFRGRCPRLLTSPPYGVGCKTCVLVHCSVPIPSWSFPLSIFRTGPKQRPRTSEFGLNSSLALKPPKDMLVMPRAILFPMGLAVPLVNFVRSQQMDKSLSVQMASEINGRYSTIPMDPP